MAEYINRERARFEAKRYFKNMDEIQEDLDMLFCMLPAENVAPVRHGRWIFGKDLPYSWGKTPKNKYHLYCSECLEQAFNRSEDNDPDFDVDTPYCPNCGAKMDLHGECEQEVER